MNVIKSFSGGNIMVSAIEKRKNGRGPIIYSKNGKDKPDEPHMVMEDSFLYMAPCPVCEKRVFDISDPPDKLTLIRLKCPHCRNIVKIPIYTP